MSLCLNRRLAWESLGIPYHQIKCKLNSKSQKSQNIKIWRAAKIELKHLICYKQGHSLENMYTSVWSAHQV